MGDCRVGEDNSFPTLDTAKGCFEELKKKTKRPVIIEHYPFASIGTAAISPYVVRVFTECFEGVKFDDWVTITSPSNEAWARFCAERLADINSGKKYTAIKTQHNRVRANFWQVVKK